MSKAKPLPSEERPWEKYYPKDKLGAQVPHTSLYEALVKENADNMDGIAFVQACRNDSKITYSDFINLTGSVAKSLIALDVAPGAEIAATFKNAVEGIALVFGKSRVGAFSHLIDPTNNPREIYRMLCEANAKLLFASQEFAGYLAGNLAGTGVETLVVMPSDDGSNDVSALADEAVRILDWEAFIGVGSSVELGDPYIPAADEGSIVVYTGGSTGRSKGVILSDYAFVAKYYREAWSRLKWGRGRITLCSLPATIGYGLSEGVTIPLLAGACGIIVDCYAIPKFAEFVLKYRPKDAACSPIHMQYFVNSPLISDDTDLSFMEMFPSGGDGMSLEADVMVREFLRAHGANDSYGQGCGFTETAGAFCFGQGIRNKPGGMGIPLIGNTCGVFDTETGTELGFGETGEWAVRTDTAMLGYFGSASEKDAEALRVHDDGSVWLHPGDIVHMDEDGVIYMHDRVSRTFNLDGMKVYPSALESILSTHPAIAKCVVSGVKVGGAEGASITDSKVPIINAELNPGYRGKEAEIATELVGMLEQKAQTYIRVSGIVFREQIPFTSRGKVDYQLLESEALESGATKTVVQF